MGETVWSRGSTFLELVESAGTERASLDAAFDAVRVSPEVERFFATFPRKSRIMALGNLEEEESRINLAQAERLFSLGKRLWMRTFSVGAHADLVKRFPSSQWPLLVFFGDDRREFARWGPRPRVLQEQERDDEAPSLAVPRRLAFYRDDAGQSLAQDLLRILAVHAGLPLP